MQNQMVRAPPTFRAWFKTYTDVRREEAYLEQETMWIKFKADRKEGGGVVGQIKNPYPPDSSFRKSRARSGSPLNTRWLRRHGDYEISISAVAYIVRSTRAFLRPLPGAFARHRGDANWCWRETKVYDRPTTTTGPVSAAVRAGRRSRAFGGRGKDCWTYDAPSPGARRLAGRGRSTYGRSDVRDRADGRAGGRHTSKRVSVHARGGRNVISLRV